MNVIVDTSTPSSGSLHALANTVVRSEAFDQIRELVEEQADECLTIDEVVEAVTDALAAPTSSRWTVDDGWSIRCAHGIRWTYRWQHHHLTLMAAPLLADGSIDRSRQVLASDHPGLDIPEAAVRPYVDYLIELRQAAVHVHVDALGSEVASW